MILLREIGFTLLPLKFQDYIQVLGPFSTPRKQKIFNPRKNNENICSNPPLWLVNSGAKAA
jgi:hypothetical protein